MIFEYLSCGLSMLIALRSSTVVVCFAVLLCVIEILSAPISRALKLGQSFLRQRCPTAVHAAVLVRLLHQEVDLIHLTRLTLATELVHRLSTRPLLGS